MIILTICPNRNTNETNPELIKNAYTNSLQLAQENNIQSIAFPLISSAIYGFTDIKNYGNPQNPVAPALQAFEEFAQSNPDSNPKTIRLAIPDKKNYQIIKAAIAQHHGQTFIEQPQIAPKQSSCVTSATGQYGH